MAFLHERERQYVATFLKERLERPVKIVAFGRRPTRLEIPGVRRNPLAEQTLELMAELGRLSDLIDVTIAYVGEHEDLFQRWNVPKDRLPAIVLTPEDGRDRGVWFFGAPAGYEFRTLMEDLVDVSRGTTSLSDETRAALRGLSRPVHIQVFVTPTCPYCPQAVRLAHQFALESDQIRGDMIEATEFPELARRYGVYGVPKTVINETEAIEGAAPEAHVLQAVLKAAGGREADEAAE
ncbi:MAG TPA: thioredoxin family protein [Limnochorda sp.]